MGTRHLIAVQIDGAYKIAQYGQWDGNPACTGIDVLRFLQTCDIESFKNKVRHCSFLTSEDVDAINNELKTTNKTVPKDYPHLSRDASANILNIVANSKPLKLKNDIWFAADSMFCEWGYVIDFDKNTFEVYEGGGYKKPASGERFTDLKTESGIIGLVKSFPLDQLPSEDDFLTSVEPAEAD